MIATNFDSIDFVYTKYKQHMFCGARFSLFLSPVLSLEISSQLSCSHFFLCIFFITYLYLLYLL